MKKVKKNETHARFSRLFWFFRNGLFSLQKITLRRTSCRGDIYIQWQVSCFKLATESTLHQRNNLFQLCSHSSLKLQPPATQQRERQAWVGTRSRQSSRTAPAAAVLHRRPAAGSSHFNPFVLSLPLNGPCFQSENYSF